MKFRNYKVEPGRLIISLGSGRGRHYIRRVFGFLGKGFFLGYLKTEPVLAPPTGFNKEEVSEVWRAFDETFEKMGDTFKEIEKVFKKVK